MLASTLGRNTRHRAFHKFQQRLLNPLAAHIARDARIFRFPRHLIDFVDIDNPALCLVNVVIGRLQELQYNIFDILTDIARLGQCRGVCHRKRNINNARQRLGQQRFTRSRWTQDKNV